MLVTRQNFDLVLTRLKAHRHLSLDTETTGLRPHHGDRLFSIIIGAQEEGRVEGYYFNFQAYANLAPDFVLTPKQFRQLDELFLDPLHVWFIHNAKFDMSMLAAEGSELRGTIHCTKAIGRVEYNDRPAYDLGSLLKPLSLAKSDAVEKYIEEKELFDVKKLPGKNKKVKIPHYDRVPFDLITAYGELDATGTFSLGLFQKGSLAKQASEVPKELPSLSDVMQQERQLTKTVFAMEQLGVKIDRKYCVRAAQFEDDRCVKAAQGFKRETGRAYLASPKLFKEVFESEKDKWVFGEPTKTGQVNPSFESDVLKKFQNPAAKLVLELRDAKAKADFYQGFLYHADSQDRIHPNFNPDGTRHGRFSSSDPNFQNLTSEDSEEDLAQEFVVRRAIIPADGFFLVSIDYKAMEFRFMLEQACKLLGKETELVKLINGGLDVHDATARVASQSGVQITRAQAKVSNFLTLYGGGSQKLADDLGCTVEQAKEIRQSIFKGAPEIKQYIDAMMRIAETRPYVYNWLGRRCHFPNSAFAYRAPNYLISGGCADIVKQKMNIIESELRGRFSRMTMTVHDELVFEVHESEPEIWRDIKCTMETHPMQYLPLLCDASMSRRSLADLEAFPA